MVWSFFLRHPVSARSLLVGVGCGLASVLIDMDHIPQALGLMVAGRLLHTPILIVSIVGCACVGGLLVRNILKMEDPKWMIVFNREGLGGIVMRALKAHPIPRMTNPNRIKSMPKPKRI